ncbi:hypothetical protein ACFZDF_30485 [Streptomyces sp. NPDC007910]|uniref:hypothetical protein n=1 Tax=Streptomyces sp. NPDC007910 TaxID=3364790 RepID=UPI0036E65BB4
MTGDKAVGLVVIDLGQGREIKSGKRAGQISWTRQPSAHYECLVCGKHTDTVTGIAAVQKFISHISTTHRIACTATTTERNAS